MTTVMPKYESLEQSSDWAPVILRFLLKNQKANIKVNVTILNVFLISILISDSLRTLPKRSKNWFIINHSLMADDTNKYNNNRNQLTILTNMTILWIKTTIPLTYPHNCCDLNIIYAMTKEKILHRYHHVQAHRWHQINLYKHHELNFQLLQETYQ